MNLVLLFSSKRQVGFFFMSSHLIAGDLNCYNKLATLCFTGTCMWVGTKSSQVEVLACWKRAPMAQAHLTKYHTGPGSKFFSQNLHSRYSVPMKYRRSMSNTLRTVLYKPDCVRYSWKKWYIIGEKSVISMIIKSNDALLNITMLSPMHKWKLYSCPHKVIFTFVLWKDKTIISY